MSKEKADQAVEKLKDTLKDFPTFILFAVGEEGGFALSGVEAPFDKHYPRLAAQMTDSLLASDDTLKFLKVVIEEVELRKKNAAN